MKLSGVRLSDLNSSNGRFSTVHFGLAGDIPLPANYDRDGKSDLTVFRPSTGVWYEYLTHTGTIRIRKFGQNGDTAVPSDYDGDGLNDLAIYRSGVWWVLGSYYNSVQIQQFGLPEDIPVPVDYLSVFGDTAAEIAVFRPSKGFWYISFYDFGGVSIIKWGLNGDIPISLVNR